jgi:hypothetical protein
MLDWVVIEDGYIIFSKMSDQEVWCRAQLFGTPALIEAIEIYLEIIELTIEGKK